MDKITHPKPVVLVMALMANSPAQLEKAKIPLMEEFGSIELESDPYLFDYSSHYEKEMGKELVKQFISFAELIERDKLAKIKAMTNRIEKSMASRRGKECRRTVNIDPGYLSSAKLVLATNKNYSHRIYLGGGVFAEVALFYRHGGFQPLDWTYPDYRSQLARQFFAQVKEWLLSKTHSQGQDLSFM